MAVIDIGSYSLKALRRGKTYEVVLPPDAVGGTFTIPLIDGEAFGTSLASLRSMSGVRSCHLLLPDQWARQLFVTVDDVPEGYTRDYLVWRAKEQIRDEVHSGCVVEVHARSVTKVTAPAGEDERIEKLSSLPQYKKAGKGPAQAAARYTVDLYVCLVKEELLESLNSLFGAAGIEILSVDLTSHALYNGISSSGKLVPDFSIINIGHDVTTVYFFNEFEPAYVRIIETAGRHFALEVAPAGTAPAESGAAISACGAFPASLDAAALEAFDAKRLPVTEKLMKELHLTFEFFESKYPHVKLACVFLAGGMARTPGIREFLAGFLDVPAEFAGAREGIEFTPLYGIGDK